MFDMTKSQRELLIRALEFYRDERQLDNLPQDEEFRYYDYDENGNVTYKSVDAIDANNMGKLLESFD
ncbi:hypothetical protein Nizo2029_2291 [Lactiplantibacillus plantarum]|nr:hypothetical protein Nizo2029_2291 [Lactiplantibacillus plantarum]